MQWLTPVGDYDGKARQDDAQSDTAGSDKSKAHGTAMLSLVAGKTLGVAKSITPHIVRLPRKVSTGGYWSPEDFLETMADAANAMEAGSESEAKGIVLIAMYYPRSRFFRIRGENSHSDPDMDSLTFDESLGFAQTLSKIIDNMAGKGYLVVTPAGNAGSPKIDGWPANFGYSKDEFYKKGLVVVGAVSPNSTGTVYGNVDKDKGLPHLYAPGDGTTVAEGNVALWDKDEYYRDGQGTSDGEIQVSCHL